jgi:hypothetical protein
MLFYMFFEEKKRKLFYTIKNRKWLGGYFPRLRFRNYFFQFTQRVYYSIHSTEPTYRKTQVEKYELKKAVSRQDAYIDIL